MKNFFGISLISLMVSCVSPAPIVKLTPSTLEHKDYWNLGQQYVFTNSNNIWFDCAFNRREGSKLIFDVKITNHSDTAVLVDPARFFQRVYQNDSVKIAQNQAFDPEIVLTSFQMQQNIARANARNAAILGVTSAVISTGAIIAIEASEKNEEKKVLTQNIIAATNDVAQVTAGATMEDANIREERNWTMQKSLAQLFLRKTTLPQGYFLEGEVHFYYFENAKWYDIVLPVGDTEVTFLFKQRIIYPQVNNYNQGPTIHY